VGHLPSTPHRAGGVIVGSLGEGGRGAVRGAGVVVVVEAILITVTRVRQVSRVNRVSKVSSPSRRLLATGAAGGREADGANGEMEVILPSHQPVNVFVPAVIQYRQNLYGE